MPSHSSEARVVAALIASGLSFAFAGCARQKVQAAPPVAAAPAPSAEDTQRPLTLAPDTTASPQTEETMLPPPAIPNPPPPPPAVVAPHPKPAKPTRPVAEPAAEPPADQPAHP